jgi:hypothetical protein
MLFVVLAFTVELVVALQILLESNGILLLYQVAGSSALPSPFLDW